MPRGERKLLINLYADGRVIELSHHAYINAVDLTNTRDPNKASIVVHNLGKANRGILSGDHQALDILAGYGQASKIFSGQTYSVVHLPPDGSRPGWETTIEAGDGVKSFSTSWTSNAWVAGTPLGVVMSDLAADLGIHLDNRLQGTLNAAWAYNGKTSEALSEVCGDYGAGWVIYQGVLEVTSTDESIDRTSAVAVEVSKLTGMLGSPEVVERKGKGRFGVSSKMLMSPTVRPNGLVKITSGSTGGMARNRKGVLTPTPGANGVYKVKRVTHYGSLYTNDFYSEFETESFSV